MVERWPQALATTAEVVPIGRTLRRAADTVRVEAIISRAGGNLTAQRLADLALEEDQAARRARARGDIEEARACEIVRDTLCAWLNAGSTPIAVSGRR